MRTRIGLLAQPKSMRSIIDATRRAHGTVQFEISASIEMASPPEQNYPQMNLQR